MHNFGGFGAAVDGLRSGRGADLIGAKNCSEAIAKSCGKIDPLLMYLEMDGNMRKGTEDWMVFLRRHLVENLLNQKIVNTGDDRIEVCWNQVSRDFLHRFRVVLEPATELACFVRLVQSISDVVYK